MNKCGTSIHGILLSNKKEWTDTDICNNLDKSQKQDAKWKKQTQNTTCYVILFIWHSGKGNRKSDQCLPGAGGGKSVMTSEGQERTFQSNGKVLCLHCAYCITAYICQNSPNRIFNTDKFYCT